jgi:uncharacterized protein (DUF488 family)
MTEPAAAFKVVTIGVFGSTEAGFFDALLTAGVDTFCDIRWRRGVRGSEYVYVNSARLQKRLGELGIRYLHLRDLAPRPELRQRQAMADKASGATKRTRERLGEAFAAGYHEQCLDKFDPSAFVERIGNVKTIALFCVEREPAACHRSLLAEKLRATLGVSVEHLIPH